MTDLEKYAIQMVQADDLRTRYRKAALAAVEKYFENAPVIDGWGSPTAWPPEARRLWGLANRAAARRGRYYALLKKAARAKMAEAAEVLGEVGLMPEGTP